MPQMYTIILHLVTIHKRKQQYLNHPVGQKTNSRTLKSPFLHLKSRKNHSKNRKKAVGSADDVTTTDLGLGNGERTSYGVEQSYCVDRSWVKSDSPRNLIYQKQAFTLLTTTPIFNICYHSPLCYIPILFPRLVSHLF